jgi:hypothetical protein
MIPKYLVVDYSDIYQISVSEYETKDDMLNAAQYKNISDIKVYEISRAVRLESRTQIIEQN